MKGLTTANILKEIKFEGVWGELEAKISFQRQSLTNYLRLTNYLEIVHYRKSLFSVFQGSFASITKFFKLAGRRH